MSHPKFTYTLLIIILNVFCLDAKIVKDTLYTLDGDRIIVSYEILQSNDCYTIKFNNSQKKLSRTNSEKYNNHIGDVTVMFFDRTGGFSDDVSITNMVPEAFMIPPNVNYEYSSDGFFIVQDYPTLNFATRESCEINIPVYLAYRTRRGKYSLFSKCLGMRISLSTMIKDSNSQLTNSRNFHLSNTSITGQEIDNPNVLKVLGSIKLTKELLNKSESLPFSETLQDEILFIRQQKRDVTDPNLLAQITELLEFYEEKKNALEEKKQSEQIAKQQEAEVKAKLQAEAMQAKNDSIISAQQEKADAEKKESRMMLIGGIILAIIAFIGNQVFQNLRNSRNQRNMMNIQETIASKAEAEAKRRARSTIRSTTDKTINKVKNDTRESLSKKKKITINGKSKNVSI